MPYKLIAVLDFPRSVWKFIPYARNVATCLTGNAFFPDCPVPPSALSPLVDDLHDAAQEARNLAVGAVQARDHKRTLVETALRHDCGYVQSVIMNAPVELGEVMLASSGFGQKEPSTHGKEPYTATRGLVAGDVFVDVKALGRHGTLSYCHQHSIDAGQSWVDAVPTLDTRIVFTGLPVGVWVWFRFRTLVKGVYGDWSNILKFLTY